MLPVVLHHGIFGFDQVQVGPVRIAYFGGGIEQEITDRGHPIIMGRVSRTGSVAVRAEQLKQIILSELARLGTPDARVIVLAHSMGGLDARYMVHHLDMAHRVAAIVTLSTPHHGSSYADWAIKTSTAAWRCSRFSRRCALICPACAIALWNHALDSTTQFPIIPMSLTTPFPRHALGIACRLISCTHIA